MHGFTVDNLSLISMSTRGVVKSHYFIESRKQESECKACKISSYIGAQRCDMYALYSADTHSLGHVINKGR